jgi:hypothetical protein
MAGQVGRTDGRRTPKEPPTILVETCIQMHRCGTRKLLRSILPGSLLPSLNSAPVLWVGVWAQSNTSP